MNEKIIGSGFAFPLQINRSGGLALAHMQDELEQSMKIILATPVGQRVMRPTFGSRLHELVFEPNDSQTAAKACRFVEEALGMWEPRVTVANVNAFPEGNSDRSALTIEIQYEVRHTRDPRTLVYPFYLIPDETTR